MIKPTLPHVAAFLSATVCVACTERVTAPEAIEIVNSVDASLASREAPQRWLGSIWKGDLRLGAPLRSTDVRRDGAPLPYRAIVFERVVKPSERLGTSICPETRRVAYFWRADSDGVVFFPGGLFDQPLTPPLRSCPGTGVEPPVPSVTAITPDRGMWIQVSVAGDISPGVVTGACRFLKPEAERFIHDEHGITCELTSHHVRLAARLHRYAVGGLDSMRLDLDTTAIIGVRYTIDCDAAKNTVSVPCAGPSVRPQNRDEQPRPS